MNRFSKHDFSLMAKAVKKLIKTQNESIESSLLSNILTQALVESNSLTLPPREISLMTKGVTKAIERHDKTLGHSQILNALAESLGESSWQALSPKLNKETTYSKSEVLATREKLKAIMETHTLLTAFGMGASQDFSLSRKERIEKFHNDRRRLFQTDLETLNNTAIWLSKVKKTKTITGRVRSYGAKHDVQKIIGYVTNGQFIASALLAGFDIKVDSSPNVAFNMDVRSWREQTPHINR